MKNMRKKIIIALDFSQLAEAKKCVDLLVEAVFFKVGLQAFLEYGPSIISYLQEKKKRLINMNQTCG